MSLYIVDIHGDIEGDFDIIAKYKKSLNCSECIKDGTDACTRGAGRAINDEICGGFIEEEHKDIMEEVALLCENCHFCDEIIKDDGTKQPDIFYCEIYDEIIDRIGRTCRSFEKRRRK